MKLSVGWITAVLLALMGASSVAADDPPGDQGLLRLVERALPWYPESVFTISSDEGFDTPEGRYRVVAVERQCESKLLAGTITVVVDEASRTAWIGNTGRLPFASTGANPSTLGRFLEGFLPEALRESVRLRVRVEWGSGVQRPGAVIPFWLQVDTGYGEFPKPSAVTADGERLIIGSSYQLDEDPVAERRRALSSSDLVVWDRVGGDGGMVEIVEFSDLECPACRGRWPLIKSVMETEDRSVTHGMVSFPLSTIHPWAFRAASASWCVAEQDADALLPFKELFYELQQEMEVSLVTPTSVDYVAGNGLDEVAFRSCYLKQPSLDAVHRQLALGHRLGVVSTPTYFVNGWMIQAPDPAWFPDLVARLAAGEEP